MASTSPRDEALRPGTVGRVRTIAWFLRQVMSANPRMALLTLALSLVIGGITPIALWASRGVADALQVRLGGGDEGALWTFAALWVGVEVLESALNPIQIHVLHRVHMAGSRAVWDRALRKVTELDLARFESQAFYDRFARVVTDINVRGNSDQILRFSLQVLKMAIRFAAWIWILATFDPLLVVLALVPFVPAIWAWFFSGSAQWEIFREQTRERRLATYYSDLLVSRQAAKEVRLFGLQSTLKDRWSDAYWETARDLRRRAVRAGLRQRGTSALGVSVAMLIFAWYVGSRSAIPSAGMAVIVVRSFIDIYSGIIQLGRPIQELGRLAGFAEDTRALMALPSEHDFRMTEVAAAPSASELHVQGVSYTYPGAVEPVLRDITLHIAAGETIALVGENGAGKTTLVKLMLGLYQPDSGRIALDGEHLTTARPEAIRQRLSGVFQHYTRYPLSVRENISLGAALPEGEIDHSLDVVGLRQSMEDLPDQLDTVLAPDLGGVDLSGGQWQRLAIARAGVRHASLVALDEPTAALDPLAEVVIFERFAELAASRTTILVSHRLGMARLADRIITLENGRIVEEGTHEALLATPGSRYAEMWEAQARWYR